MFRLPPTGDPVNMEMTMDFKEIEVWVMLDTAGDYVTATNDEALADQWESDIGGVPVGSRVFKILLKVEMPPVVELSATVPANQGKVEMKIVS